MSSAQSRRPGEGASDAVVSRMAVIAGRGMSEARFHQPVRPGMTLTGTMTITRQRIDWPAKGEIELRNELYDQDGQRVMSMVGEIILRRREPAPAGQGA